MEISARTQPTEDVRDKLMHWMDSHTALSIPQRDDALFFRHTQHDPRRGKLLCHGKRSVCEHEDDLRALPPEGAGSTTHGARHASAMPEWEGQV